MLTHRPIALLAVFALLASAFPASDAAAETVIKFDLADVSTGPDVSYNSGVLGTADDGDAGTTGQQSTDVKYQGFLGFTSSIPNGASLTLSGITNSGSASVAAGGIVSQVTSGGMFSLFDNMNSLLLSGNLSDAVIAGSTQSSAGSFFSTAPVLYTGGSLLPLIQPNSGRISLSFTDVRTNGNQGMVVSGGSLMNFTASATGQLEASAVPEPSVIGMAAIGALVLVRHRRRRRTAKTVA